MGGYYIEGMASKNEQNFIAFWKEQLMISDID